MSAPYSGNGLYCSVKDWQMPSARRRKPGSAIAVSFKAGLLAIGILLCSEPEKYACCGDCAGW